MTGARITRITSDFKKNDICWYSARITHCADCGNDISHHDIHEVKTAEEYLASLGVGMDTKARREGRIARRLRKQGELKRAQTVKETAYEEE